VRRAPKRKSWNHPSAALARARADTATGPSSAHTTTRASSSGHTGDELTTASVLFDLSHRDQEPLLREREREAAAFPEWAAVAAGMLLRKSSTVERDFGPSILKSESWKSDSRDMVERAKR
jgi:hypothetical protein